MPQLTGGPLPHSTTRRASDFGCSWLRAFVSCIAWAVVPWAGTISADESRVENHPQVSYRNDVVPLLSRAGCNMGACHGNASGKGGFRLSLRGDDPDFDFQAMTREALGRRVSTGSPGMSLIVLKPTGQLLHEGGTRFAVDSPEARLLRAWIAQGAKDDLASAPRLKSLKVEPAELTVEAPHREAPLKVTAEFDDGTIRDVTRQASFDLNDPTLGEVTNEGVARAKRDGELAVAVRFLRGRGVSRLAFIPDRSRFTWDGPPEHNEIDRHVFGKLQTLGVNSSAPASDQVFLRRAYLDAIGRLPSAEEARGFLASSDPDKRSRVIDRLLDRPEFADFWALKWADLLRNEEKTMGSKGVWIFQRWLRDQLAADAPLDAMARTIISGTGSNWVNPPSSFYRTNRDPQTAAETVAQVFLGIRLQCARCHNHPFDDWTQDDYYGLAACFSNVKRKQVSNIRRDNLDKHEINGDEVIYLSGPAMMVQPRTQEKLPPKPLGGQAFEGKAQSEAIVGLADWLTRDNPQFARNLANRVWFHLMGRGIVEPVDDFRASNPPSNPALLDAITDELVRNGFRLRPLVALIMKSQVYQLDSRPVEDRAGDPSTFSRAAVKLLPAEVLLDAISQVLEAPTRFPKAPEPLRAAEFPGIAEDNPFLKAFGKPERLLTCECERTDSTSLAQAFQMINGDAVRKKLDAPGNRLGRMLDQGKPPEVILDDLYLSALCREPTSQERESILAFVKKAQSDRAAWQDVAWAILNSKEFLLRR